MAARKSPTQVVTANRLRDGEVVYLAPDGAWSERLDGAAAATGDEEQAALETAAGRAVTARLVVGPYLMPVELEGGRPRPVSQRERIRALGPSVRLDLGKQAR